MSEENILYEKISKEVGYKCYTMEDTNELENMYEISELEEQVNNINKIRDYITNLQQENQKYKEVIDKAIKFIYLLLKNTTNIDSIVLSSDNLIKLREILKG